MNAIVFCKSHGNGNGHDHDHDHGNGHGNGMVRLGTFTNMLANTLNPRY